eukprot:4295247-Lingulodinium_polyedra.AAC.1
MTGGPRSELLSAALGMPQASVALRRRRWPDRWATSAPWWSTCARGQGVPVTSLARQWSSSRAWLWP